MGRVRSIPDLTEATAAAEAIRQRRTGCDPERSDLDFFPGTDRGALAAVVEFVNTRRRVPPPVLHADDLDVLTITKCLRVHLERQQFYALRRLRAVPAGQRREAGRPGASWQQIADRLDLRFRQAAQLLFLRLADLFEGDDGTRSADSARARRGSPTQPKRRKAASAASTRSVTVDPARVLTRHLVELRDEAPEDIAEDLGQLGEDLDGGGPFVAAARDAIRSIRAESLTGPVRDAAERLAEHLGLSRTSGVPLDQLLGERPGGRAVPSHLDGWDASRDG